MVAEDTKPSDSGTRSPAAPRMAVILGGIVDERVRREVREKTRPRIDVLEFESKFGARVYDFAHLQRAARAACPSSIPPRLALQTHRLSVGLACDALHHIKDDDIVYATGEDVGFPLAILLRTQRKRPRLLVRLEDPNSGRTPLRRAVFGLLRDSALQHIDKILCCTTAQLQYLHGVANVPIDRLTLLCDKTDSDFYRPEGLHGSGDLGGVAAQPFIVSAGLERRDYATLIEAVRGLPVNLVIGAHSPWSHDHFVGYARHEMPPNVHVSSFSPLQMRDLYNAAAFVVLPIRPSLRACGINVLMEAWAMGKAVVATRTAGLLDYIVHGENGLFVKSYSVEDLRDAIIHLFEHRDMASRLGSAGQTVVRKDLDLDCFVSNVQEIASAVLRTDPAAVAGRKG